VASDFKLTHAVGSTTAGAIVGSNETPFAAVDLFGDGSAQSTLTTGDISIHDPGDFGGASEFTIEFWFKFDSGISSSVAFLIGPVSTSGASRQWSLTYGTSRTITLSVLDSGTIGRGGVSNPLTAGDWHHIVVTARAGVLYLYIDNVQHVADTNWAGKVVIDMGSTANQMDVRLTGPIAADNGLDFFWDELAIYNVALSTTRIAAHYQAGVQMGFPAQSIKDRLNGVLDNVGSYAPRSFQSGVRSVIQRYMSGQSPLEESRRAVESDDVDAALFTDASGVLTFLAADHRSNAPYTTSQATFGDGGGSERPYLEYESDYSPTFLINDWNVTRTTWGPLTPITQSATDATSVSRYGKRSISITDVPVSADTSAANIATALLAKYKDPMQRVTSFSPKMADGDAALAVYNLELMDKITVKRRPPGGGSVISQDLFVQSITHAGTPGVPPSCTLGVSPL